MDIARHARRHPLLLPSALWAASLLLTGAAWSPAATDPAVQGADDARDVGENWPRLRGADGLGRVPATAVVPTTWDASSVVWKADLPGRGQSSPVVWGGRVFLTAAKDDGRERVVLAVDRANGKPLWERSAWKGEPEKTHKMNGWATPTCATDGTHVWAWFGKAGVHCYTVAGEPVWSRDLGEFATRNARGVASSPAVVGDVLVVNGDSETDPFLFGLDKSTGKTVWKTARPAAEGYSTPVVVTVGGKPELVLNGDTFVAGYDPTTGKELWRCKSFAGRGEPVPAVGPDGTVYVVNGLQGDVYAVRTGGRGDVTKTHMAWHTSRKQGRDEPSPVLVGDFLLVANMAGILTCYEAKTGKELWKERIGKGDVTATPLAVGGRAYFPFENGQTVVVEPTAGKLVVVARNALGGADGELFRASPVPVGGGRLLLRSDRALYCVK
jgi:outer membrane protein assembly factor BamB